MTPEEFHAHAAEAADADGRLPLSRMTAWEVFPFEPEGLQVVRLDPPQLPEPPRRGEAGEPCGACDADRPVIWSDAHWRLSTSGDPTGAPCSSCSSPTSTTT